MPLPWSRQGDCNRYYSTTSNLNSTRSRSPEPSTNEEKGDENSGSQESSSHLRVSCSFLSLTPSSVRWIDIDFSQMRSRCCLRSWRRFKSTSNSSITFDNSMIFFILPFTRSIPQTFCRSYLTPLSPLSSLFAMIPYSRTQIAILIVLQRRLIFSSQNVEVVRKPFSHFENV